MFKEFAKKHSTRELILLGVLVFLVVYYLAVQVPVSKIGARIDSEQASVNAMIDEDTQKADLMPVMLKKIKDAKDSKTPMTPDFDNYIQMISEFNQIFGGSENYTISFDEMALEGNIVRKPMQLQFSAASYADAVDKIRALERSNNSYLLNDTSITTNNANDRTNGGASVSVSLTAFEYKG